jgi:enterochelin esterase-like enzyme
MAVRSLSGRFRARVVLLGTAVLVAVFVAVGFVGVKRYGMNYWLYRGFAPPKDPVYVVDQGTPLAIHVTSPALGGKTQPVDVYLPPGYDTHPLEHYPVIYFLHGFPGVPNAFLLTVRVGVVEDELYAQGLAQPAILVMPFGSTSQFVDKEWANGVHRGEGWSTFVSRDLVHAIDATYRTIPSRDGRAIVGLSEGGYGAINIALHNPREFAVVESWSGYERAPSDHSIFGRRLQNVAANTPLDFLPSVAPALRRAHTYFWFYTGRDDPLRKQNIGFAAELTRLHIPHEYFEVPGGHNWALWRREAERSMRAALRRLAHG